MEEQVDIIRNFYSPTSSLLTSLVAWWSMKETSGTRYDSHTNGLDLVDTNTVGTGTIGGENAANFDIASSEYFSHPDDDLLDFTTGFSISMWLNPDVWTDYNCLAAKGPWGASSFHIYTVGAGNYLRVLWNYSNIVVWSDTPSNTGWTGSAKHLVITYDGDGSTNADKVKIYINGVNQTLTFNGTMPSSLINRTGELRIGSSDGGISNYDGLMADVGMWSRALTDDEVSTLYNSGTRIEYPFV